MKLLKLEVYNLASLAAVNGQPQVVDFASAPLAGAGLSAIVGPTGAGKSTLLDALCLALFDEVPRLRSASNGQAGVVQDVAEHSLAFGDKRNMLTRGTAVGYAKVTFATHDGQQYRAEWHVQRARQRVNGALQKVNRSVIALATGTVLASQKNECAQLIVQLIGMTFDQFTRAVLLAQSEFGAFLKANDNERAALLECLTDTNIYSRLGLLAYQKSKTAQDALKHIDDQLGFSQPLPASQRQALQQQLEQLNAQKQHSQNLRDAAQQMVHWLSQDAQYVQQAAEQQLRCQQAEHDLAAAQPLKQQIDDYDAIAPMRHVWQRQQVLTQQHSALANTLIEQQQQLQQAQQQQHDAKAQCDRAQDAINTHQQADQQLAPTFAHALDIEKQRDEHRLAYTHQTAVCQDAQQQLDQFNAQIQQHANDVAQAAAQLQHLEQQLTQTDGFLGVDGQSTDSVCGHIRQAARAQQHYGRLRAGWAASLTAALDDAHGLSLDDPQDVRQDVQHDTQQDDQHDPTQYLVTQLATLTQQIHAHQQQYGDDASLLAAGQAARQQASHVAQQHDAARQLLHQLNSQHTLQQRQQQIQTQLAALQTDIHSTTQALQHAQQQHQLADQHHQQLQGVWQRQRQMSEDAVTQLRHSLQPEQPCPVCGSCTHPWVDQSHVLAAVVHESEQAVHAAAQRLAEQTEQVDQHRRVLLTQQTEQQLLQQAIQPIDEAAWQRCVVAAHAFDLSIDPHQIAAAVAHLEAKLAQYQTQQQQAQHAQQQADHAWHTRQQWYQQRQHVHDRQQASLQHERDCTLAHGQLQLHQAQFLPLLTDALQQTWHDAASDDARLALAETWCQALQQRHAQHSTRQTLTEQIQQQQQQQRYVTDQAAVQQQQQQQHDTRRQQIAQQGRTLTAELHQLQQVLAPAAAASSRVEQWKTARTEHAHALHHAFTQAQQHLHTCEKRTERLEQSIQHSQQQQRDLRIDMDALQQTWHNWYAQHTHLALERVQQLIALDVADMAAIKSRYQALQDQSTHAAQQAHMLQQQRQQHQTKRPTDCPDQLLDAQQIMAQHQQQLDQHQHAWALVFAQISEDDRRQQHAADLGQARANAQREYNRWTTLAAPIGCATGAVFRKIAQGYQLDLLLAQANAQLEQLSRRYRLMRAGNTLGLLVIDRDMGDECRSVHSLSGGESFLVSLALALGLAGMASGTLNIESLFIDEGFGTLDPDSLQMVMDALDQLQAQGRKVTVITHVQDMQERIPVQIQVTRSGLGHSRVVVTDRPLGAA